jgi:hypothetical protein
MRRADDLGLVPRSAAAIPSRFRAVIHFPDRASPPGEPADESAHASVGILYEHDEWLGDLFEALAARGIDYEPIRMDDAAVALDRPPAHPVIFNRVSPSSYPFATTLLGVFASHGRRLVNGADAFRYETSKIDQHLLFRRLGVAAPATIVFNNTRAVLEQVRRFPFPAILKPNCGGSGAFVRRVEHYDHLVALLEDDPDLFGPDHLLLLQAQLAPRDGTVTRIEFIDGELVYAMRVRSTNTFNLCPAESCERHSADPHASARPHVEFEPYPDVAPDAVAQGREIVRAASLDVGGVEFIESEDGTRWFFDINATSVYRRDICEALGLDPMGKLVDFITRELHKEIAKRAWPVPAVSAGARRIAR